MQAEASAIGSQAKYPRGVLNTLGLVACGAMIAYALYEQHVVGLEPCHLCILQRVAVIALGVLLREVVYASARPFEIGTCRDALVLSCRIRAIRPEHDIPQPNMSSNSQRGACTRLRSPWPAFDDVATSPTGRSIASR